MSVSNEPDKREVPDALEWKPWNFRILKGNAPMTDERIFKFLHTPDIWPIGSIADTPETALRQWQVFEVRLPRKPGKTRHFVGYSVQSQAGQVSSAIERFDPTRMRGVTQSGRVYQLLGPPGCNGDAEHTWGRWKSICGLADAVDVTGSIEFSGENEP